MLTVGKVLRYKYLTFIIGHLPTACEAGVLTMSMSQRRKLKQLEMKYLAQAAELTAHSYEQTFRCLTVL